MNIKFGQARILYSPDGLGGGEPDEDSIREAGFQRLIDRYKDDAIGLARELYRENYQARRKAADLSSQLAEARTKVPAEGSIVLTGDQALQWSAYQAIGTPEQVKEAVEAKEELQGKLDKAAREALLREAADTTGFVYDVLLDADALAEQRGGKRLAYEIKEVEINGEKKRTAFVKDGDLEKPLSEYAQENWAKLMPSLSASQGSGQGTPYPSQFQGGGAGSKPSSPRQATEATLNKQYTSRTPQTSP